MAGVTPAEARQDPDQVDAALAALEREAGRATATGDPTASVLVAMAGAVVAMRTMMAGVEALRQSKPDQAALVSASLKEVRRAVMIGLPQAAYQASRRLVLIGIAAVVIACAASAGAGYWYGAGRLSCGYTTQDGRTWCQEIPRQAVPPAR